MTGSDHARAGVFTTALGLFAAVALASGLVAYMAALAGWARAELVLPPLIGGLLVAASAASRRLRPVLLVLAATVVGLWLIAVGLALVAGPTGGWPLACRILLATAAKIIPVAVVVAVLVAYGRIGGADLRVGDWRARSGIRLAGHDVDWRWVGGIVAVLVCGGTVASGAADLTGAGVRAALLWLPVIALAAAVNAVTEELLFRHAVNASDTRAGRNMDAGRADVDLLRAGARTRQSERADGGPARPGRSGWSSRWRSNTPAASAGTGRCTSPLMWRSS